MCIFLWWISQLMWKETELCILCLLTDVYVYASVASGNCTLRRFAMIWKMASKHWHIKGAEIGLSKYLSTSDNCEGIANALRIIIHTVCTLLREKVFMLLCYLSALTVLFLLLFTNWITKMKLSVGSLTQKYMLSTNALLIVSVAAKKKMIIYTSVYDTVQVADSLC